MASPPPSPPSSHPGLGAIPYGGGTAFRVWAPSAVGVAVTGDFTGWSAGGLALASEPGGLWSADIPGALPGQAYQYLITNGSGVLPPRVDPYARQVVNDDQGLATQAVIYDEGAFDWGENSFASPGWTELVIYELHVGSFNELAGQTIGTLEDAAAKLPYLRDLGINALELLPVATFEGAVSWGYDPGVPFSVERPYGGPDGLKAFVQAAHALGIAVILDVVYNHFGPEGNYLHQYAPDFFTDRHHTPWGSAINFDGPGSVTVRDFFIQNALYWLEEYHFDGLRFDAVHAIIDDSTPDILTELAEAVRSTVGPDRHVHLILENERNQARYLQRTELCNPRTYTAQWNDDIHHALHVIVTGERDGYYSDYSERPLELLGRCLVGGFGYQGEVSRYKNGETRGEPTTGLPLTAFVSFLQNHDQIGNRAFGERVTKIADPRAVRAALEIVLLGPSPPLLFMGEEFGTETPFLFFCDFGKDLAAAVTVGRRKEFARFVRINDPSARGEIPDPNAARTFEASRLDWDVITQPQHREWLRFYRQLLRLRCQHIVSRLSAGCVIKGECGVHANHGLTADWQFSDGSKLTLLANLGTAFVAGFTSPAAQMIYASEKVSADTLQRGTLPPWSVMWLLES